MKTCSRSWTLSAAILLGPGAALAETPLSARDAGARFGQALGAIEICIGARITEKATALKASFTGADATAFEDQAAKVFQAWLKVKGCARPDDPNQCKIMMDLSCAAAIAEIGPDGSAVSGLLQPPPSR